MKKYLYIPIEIYKREMPAKLIFALRAAKRGYSVIIGRKYVVNEIALRNDKGIYFGTTVVEQEKDLFSSLKQKGYALVVQDEEGLVYYNRENYIKKRIIPEVLKDINVFLCWGENHISCLESAYSGKNYLSHGNIRMEMLKRKYYSFYEEQEKRIQNKYGKFILVNTNFVACNFVLGEETLKNNYMKSKKFDNIDRQFYSDKFEHQGNIMLKMMELVRILLAKLPEEYNIVVRPHPCENISSYDGIASERVHIVQEGSSIPWIYAAECVVQHNCTTAIEAILLNRKVFSFMPDYDERFDDCFICDVAEKYHTIEDTIHAIVSFIDDKTLDNSESKKELSYYIDNLADEDDTIEELLSVIEKNVVLTDKKIKLQPKIRYSFSKLCSFFFERKKGNKDQYKYVKFSKFKRVNIKECIKRLEKVERRRFSDLRIRKADEDTWLIEKIN